jgi:nucleoside phosphorylase
VIANKSPAGASDDRFTIAIVCALALELDAVIEVLDSGPIIEPHDGQDYVYQSAVFAGHRVLLVKPAEYGQLDAALAVQNLKLKFGQMELTLLVGICGGVAEPPGDDVKPIYLGDVIISKSITRYTHAARWYPQDVKVRNIIPQDAGKKLQQLLSFLDSDYYIGKMTTNSATLLEQVSKKTKYLCPGESEDVAFKSTYHHVHRDGCPAHCCDASPPKVCETAKDMACAKLECDFDQARRRPTYASVPRRIHIGRYASEDIVMRNPEIRDHLAKDWGILAFEMEAAGVWQLNTASLVIKAVCDYGDSHKHKQWQHFAAACAAATAKAFVEIFYPRGNSAS